MQIKALLFLSVATSLVSARLYLGGSDIEYDHVKGRVIRGGSSSFGGEFGDYCQGANLDPEVGQSQAMNVAAAVGGLDHIALQHASDDDIHAHAYALAQQFNVPLSYVGSVCGGMAEVLFSKHSQASPHYGTYVAINKVVFKDHN
ncbi:hypothetical protein HDU98_001837 [Podochytrium sp. JEL0797]|nr:hypothetical protein HDU98_001837 [Podochytrium sp. JEL0797]